MNRVELVGRLTVKPELRYTGSNLPYARFSVAINRAFNNAQGERETDFINIIVWRKQAENVCNFLDKGSLVSIEGRLQTGIYTDKDGNKRYSIDVVADAVQFLDKRSNNEQSVITELDENSTSEENDVFADFGEQVSIDDDFLD